MRPIPMLTVLAVLCAAAVVWMRSDIAPTTAPAGPDTRAQQKPEADGDGVAGVERTPPREPRVQREPAPATTELLPESVLAEASATAELAERERILAQLHDRRLSASEQSHLWRRLAELGAADDVIAALEAELAEHPDDSELHTLLGNAHVTRMRSENLSPMARMAESKAAMSSFDRALELDPENWTARFSRAMSNSRAPAFLGRQKAAIDDFEVLLKQQKLAPFSNDHAHTYAFLGNLHEGAGNDARAAEVRAEARGLFPDDERFQ